MSEDVTRRSFLLPNDVLQQVKQACQDTGQDIDKYVEEALYQCLALDQRSKADVFWAKYYERVSGLQPIVRMSTDDVPQMVLFYSKFGFRAVKRQFYGTLLEHHGFYLYISEISAHSRPITIDFTTIVDLHLLQEKLIELGFENVELDEESDFDPASLTLTDPDGNLICIGVDKGPLFQNLDHL